MKDREKIRAEIERMKKEQTYSSSLKLPEYVLGDLLAFIDTLQEEPSCPKPSDNLEEAAEEYKQGEIDTKVDYHDETGEPLCFMEALKPAFIAGAEWQKQKMMKGAVVANVSIDEFSCGLYNLCVEAGLTSEDDVEIIIRKKDEPRNP